MGQDVTRVPSFVECRYNAFAIRTEVFSVTGTRSVFIAASLDGFIARNDGNIDWLTEAIGNVP